MSGTPDSLTTQRVSRTFSQRPPARGRIVSAPHPRSKAAAPRFGLRPALLAIVVVLVLGVTVYPPLQAYYSALRSNGALSEHLDDVTASNASMQDQVDSLMTREGIEDEARRRGYVAEGDTAVDMSGVQDSSDPSTDTTVRVSGTDDASGQQQEPWYIKLFDVVFRYDPSAEGLS